MRLSNTKHLIRGLAPLRNFLLPRCSPSTKRNMNKAKAWECEGNNVAWLQHIRNVASSKYIYLVQVTLWHPGDRALSPASHLYPCPPNNSCPDTWRSCPKFRGTPSRTHHLSWCRFGTSEAPRTLFYQKVR